MSEKSVSENKSSNLALIENESSYRFGQYLNNEYELLIRTLSYLMINDLLSCARVSRSWLNATLDILRKRTRLKWHISPNKAICNHDLKSNINTISYFVLGIQKKRRKNVILNDLMQNEAFYLSSDLQPVLSETRNIPGLYKGNMLTISCFDTTIPYYCDQEIKYIEHVGTGIFFPCVEDFRIEVKYFYPAQPFSVSRDSVKGVLIFSEHIIDIIESIERFLEEFPNPISIGGGLIENISACDFRNPRVDYQLTTAISFHGENVHCYSNVLKNTEKEEVEQFFIKVKKDIGSYDARKKQRIAIVIRCVGRKNHGEELELYKKYFPDVPAFTLLSGAELECHTSCEDNPPLPKKNRKKRRIMHSFCIVYFFVTFNIA